MIDILIENEEIISNASYDIVHLHLIQKYHANLELNFILGIHLHKKYNEF